MKVLLIGALAFVAILVVAGVVTAVMTLIIAARHPPQGRFVEVEGGRLHLVERGPTSGRPAGTVLLLHGASTNQADMMLTLGDRLAERYRVVAVDRPGHGWSDRPGGRADASPARQATLLRQALDVIGVSKAIVVGHSLAGAAAANLALDHAELVCGLVLLAPATHPWPGGVTWYYTPATAPGLGWLFTHTVTLPIGLAVLDDVIDTVFAPQRPPRDYIERAATRLVLRPRAFRANAEDVKALLPFVREQSRRYGEITAPTVIVTGDADTIVSPKIHSAALAREIADAKLIVLPGVGHVPQVAAPDLVIAEIDRLAGPTRDPPWKALRR